MKDDALENRYYLGIDGGGTQTRALLVDKRGRVQGCGHAGSANRNHYSREQVRAVFQIVLREALGTMPLGGTLSTIFLGMGGVSTEADRRDIAASVRLCPEVEPPVRVIVENDTLVGLTGGLAGRPGLALIAGTGSACFGINARGERWLCGGWGALADDVGSAPWIGLRALQTAVRAEDGRHGPTRLQKIVFDFLHLSEPRQFISRVHNPGLERAEMGRLAPLVVEASVQGDVAAEAILREATWELSAMVRVTARHLFGKGDCQMILVGGLALSGPPFQSLLMEQIQLDCPQVSVHAPELSPVQGAALEALRADGVFWTKDVFANLNAMAL